MVTLSVVVTTVGRPDDLHRLLTSLADATEREDMEFVLVDQSPHRVCIRLLETLSPPFPWKTATSGQGASLGRNVGAALAEGDLLSFPDDGCTYRGDALSIAMGYLACHPLVAGVSGVQLTPDGRLSMLRWPAQACSITRRNHYRTGIESTVFIRRSAFEQLGGFDVTLGTGAQGPFQSGEISDLLLRGIEEGMQFIYDPRIVVYQPDTRDVVTSAFVDKMAGYGWGFGRVFAQHRVGVDLLAMLLGRKLLGSLVRQARGESVLAHADRSFVNGAIKGYRAWPR